MKKLLLITLLLALLISCEDTKNRKTNSLKNPIEKQIDSIESSKIIPSKPIKPKILLLPRMQWHQKHWILKH